MARQTSDNCPKISGQSGRSAIMDWRLRADGRKLRSTDYALFSRAGRPAKFYPPEVTSLCSHILAGRPCHKAVILHGKTCVHHADRARAICAWGKWLGLDLASWIGLLSPPS